MGSSVTNLFIVANVYLIMKYTKSVVGIPQVPCVFFFGDSLFDNGNNNDLITLAKVDFFPYGIDYPDGPTGRFTNGKIAPDFLAEMLGFSEGIRAYVSANNEDIFKGTNYASGGAGILDLSGKFQGGRLSMNTQVLLHGNTVSRITLLLGNATLANEYLRKCLYVVNIGNNDYINNYFLPQLYPTSTFYTPQNFAAMLTQQFTQQLQNLYDYGARKVAVYGVGLIGCVPQYLSMNGSCTDSMNEIANLFNTNLPPLIDNLTHNLLDAQFIFVNSTSIVTGDPQLFQRITDRTSPCCVVSKLTGICDIGEEPCKNRDEHYFWDNYHPSQIAVAASTARAYSAKLPSDAYPFDIRRLVQQ